MFARLSEQLSAQLSAQSTALTTVMQRFDTLLSATLPRRSRRYARQEITASRSPIDAPGHLRNALPIARARWKEALFKV